MKEFDYESNSRLMQDSPSNQKTKTKYLWWSGMMETNKIFIFALVMVTIVVVPLILISFNLRSKTRGLPEEIDIHFKLDGLRKTEDIDAEHDFELKSDKENMKDQPKRLGSVSIFIWKSIPRDGKQPSTSFRLPAAIFEKQKSILHRPSQNVIPSILASVDQNTRQSIFHLSDGNVCILPALMNEKDEIYSVAELILKGYASFVRSEISSMSGKDLLSFIQDEEILGRDIPTIKGFDVGFSGPLIHNFGSFPIPHNIKFEKESESDSKEQDGEDTPIQSANEGKKRQRRDGSTGRYMSSKQRAMVRVTTHSVVGILFDEIPVAARKKAKQILDAKPESYWIAAATQQLKYTQVRLIFRPIYNQNLTGNAKRGTLSLTLPRFFDIKFTSKPHFQTIDGHLLYVRKYKFENILITNTKSLAETDNRLTTIGGAMTETFILPVDPFLVLQRTGYACISEFQWPPDSIDPETVEYFYDHACKVEKPQPPGTVGCHQCHCSYPFPKYSCVDAVKKYIGHVKIHLHFRRITGSNNLANKWRFPTDGPSKNDKGQEAPVNIFEYTEETAKYRVIYLYIHPDGCELAEQCVGGSGWRRLLVFSTTVPNYGIEDFDIVDVTYFVNGPPTDYVTKYRLYEYSPCHKHYHFSYYVTFSYGDAITQYRKRGFCLESTYRHANAEWSVMSQNHYTCANQGIAQGWSDSYQGGLRCQWIDVTAVNTSVHSNSDQIKSQLNPEGILCEGKEIPDVWIETNLTTYCCGGSGCCGDSNYTQCCGGLPVYKPGCRKWDGWDKDNYAQVPATIPRDGEGQVTANCWNSSGTWGEKRDCGFRLHPDGKMLSCPKPGKTAFLKGVVSKQYYQAVRICEASIVLDSCLACIWNASLASVLIKEGQSPKSISFQCTPQRDAEEVGGKFCVYVAPLFEEDHHNPKHVQWSSVS